MRLMINMVAIMFKPGFPKLSKCMEMRILEAHQYKASFILMASHPAAFCPIILLISSLLGAGETEHHNSYKSHSQFIGAQSPSLHPLLNFKNLLMDEVGM